MSVARLESEPQRMLRALSSSEHVTFGCRAPYQMGKAGAGRIGYADIPVVGVWLTCRDEDVSAVVTVARQTLLRAIVAAGLDTAGVGLRPVVGVSGRAKMFLDENPSSASHGKRKRGVRVRVHLEIVADRARDYGAALPTWYPESY